MSKVQTPLPEHAPLQPTNTDPAAAVGVSATLESASKLAKQALPQSMPEGLLVTAPEPVPSLVTESVRVKELKVVVTLRDAFMTSVQGAIPEQPPPLQPTNSDPIEGVAVRVIASPGNGKNVKLLDDSAI